MAGLDDLARSEIAALKRAVRELQMAAPLRNAAVGAGGIRVHSGGMITIENGGLKVTGTAEIIGRLIASGFVDFSGEVTISGPLVVEDGGSVTIGSIEFQPDGSAKFGTLTFDPTGKITTGTAEINPDGSAKFGELTIDTAGKVTAGGVSLDPSYLSGSLRFANGTYLAATPNGAQLVKTGGGGAVTVSSSQADISAGAGGVIASNAGVALLGLPQTSQKPNLYWDPTTKQLSVSTATF